MPVTCTGAPSVHRSSLCLTHNSHLISTFLCTEKSLNNNNNNNNVYGAINGGARNAIALLWPTTASVKYISIDIKVT